MIQYDGSPEQDALLLGWWDTMRRTGDLALTFTHGAEALGRFMGLWRGTGTRLLLDFDTRGLWFTIWYEPQMSGALIGLWIRGDCRHRRATVETIERGLQVGLLQWPVLLAITKQETLAHSYERLGCKILGEVPGLFNGEPSWIVYWTQETFDARRLNTSRRRTETAVTNGR